MKFLVTGGCGFLGSNLSHHILKLGHELRIFDNLSRLGSESNLAWLRQQGDFHFYQQDIRQAQAVETALSEYKPDVIFHLSGQVAMTSSIQNPRNDFEVNALGAFNVLEAARQFCPSAKIIFSSTNKVYGDFETIDFAIRDKRYVVLDYPEGFDESLPLHFQSPYGCSKGAADQYMLDYHKIFGLQTVVFRHSSIFGGRQFATVDQGWIGWFVKQALDTKAGKLKQPFTIAGDGRQVRDILFADDLITCYFSALENINKTQGQVYNIGGGMANSFSLLELFDYLEELVGTKLHYQETPWRQSDQKVFVALCLKAQKDFSWQPKVDKFTAVKKMVDWVKSNA